MHEAPGHLSGIYEFGVFHGFGLRAWLDAMPLLNISVENISVWGFDSFRGMPDEQDGFMRQSHVHDRNWHAGGLNVARSMGIHDWHKLHDAILRNIESGSNRTHLVRGFYNESLVGGIALRQQLGMPPALLLDIDCDLYSSTKQALNFMLMARLLRPGTYVYYDDYTVEEWNISPTRHPYKEERLAHEEITREFELKWKPLNSLKYRGPMESLGWIRQWPNTSHLMNKRLLGVSLSPVFRLESCGKC